MYFPCINQCFLKNPKVVNVPAQRIDFFAFKEHFFVKWIKLVKFVYNLVKFESFDFILTITRTLTSIYFPSCTQPDGNTN